MMSHESIQHQRILVIDDNLSIHDDFRKILSETNKDDSSLASMEADLFGDKPVPTTQAFFEIDYASQGQEGLVLVEQAIQQGRPYALAFVDGRMPPGWDGIETIAHLWQASPELQIVLCTAYADYSWQEIQQKLGATDSMVILKKPFDNVEVLQLAHALTRKWELNHLVQGQLHRLAYYDSLTGLPNRVMFMDFLSNTLKRANRAGHTGALLFVDLDNFKRINDTLGHSMGDELLKVVAKRLSCCIRESDCIALLTESNPVARMGGDEFAILLHEIDTKVVATTVAQRVSTQLAAPIDLGEHQVMVTPSVGIALFPNDGNTAEILLKNSDMAMYFAKRNGPNNVEFYEETMHADALQRLILENRLRQALDLGELSLHYQPQFDLLTGKISGLEALLRWHNQEIGNIPPLEFIPIAEDSGLIISIGEWILRTACNQAQQWTEQGHQIPRIGVNVSMQQFLQPDFLSMVEQILKETRLDPRKLQIEITESLLLKDPTGTTAMLSALNQMNIQVAIDDFGTGYSNLSRLRDIPIDCLKIDRAFVNGIEDNLGNQAILSSMIAMAKGMDLDVIAEGVETKYQYDFLKEKHCHEAQGFMLSRPLSQAHTDTFLQQITLEPVE